jgi:hypothetical protein
MIPIWTIALGALAIFVLSALIVGLVFLVVFIARQLGGTVGGWRRLVEVYATANPPTAPIAARETVQVGATVYKRCASLSVADEGLYIRIWRKTALIPWSEFRSIGQTQLYWQTMPKLTIGDPPVATLTVPVAVFQQMQPRLPQSLAPA